MQAKEKSSIVQVTIPEVKEEKVDGKNVIFYTLDCKLNEDEFW